MKTLKTLIIVTLVLLSGCMSTMTFRVTTRNVHPATAETFHRVAAVQKKLCTNGVLSERRDAYVQVRGPVLGQNQRPLYPRQAELTSNTTEETTCINE